VAVEASLKVQSPLLILDCLAQAPDLGKCWGEEDGEEEGGGDRNHYFTFLNQIFKQVKR